MNLFKRSINRYYMPASRPERIIQFGDGNFLRGFFDWMLQKANARGSFNGNAVIVQNTDHGRCAELQEQGCVYTVVSRGKEGVKGLVVDSISRCLNPYEDYESFVALADIPSMRFVVSNTTEAGICYEKDQSIRTPSHNFPAKVTALLYRRYCQGLPGFIFLPCELIDHNGEELKKCIMLYGDDWNLGIDFLNWVNMENTFCSTLVDRIVPGAPEEELRLQYQDAFTVMTEYYHLWVVEGPRTVRQELPFETAGLNVLWTEDLTPYRDRKVRILNGAHTASVGYAMLHEIPTVGEFVKTPRLVKHMKAAVYDEIIPTLDLPREESEAYAVDVFSRFANPFISHEWKSISLNSVSKFRVRVLPSIKTYCERFGAFPRHLVFSLYCLILMYRTFDVQDDPAVIRKLRGGSIADILHDETLWGEDLSFLTEEVEKYDHKLQG